MKPTFRATTADDRIGLSDFLAECFGTTAAAPSLDPALMAWKYWDRREDWTEPRSYVLEREGRIIAHAGLWPIEFPEGPAPARGVHMIDWAAAKDSPGAGLAIVQKLAAMFDFIFAIGGSEMTRKVLPAFGFQETARAWTAARPLRPLRQVLSHQHRNWKLAPRLARNFLWSKSLAGLPSGWKAVHIIPAEIRTGPRPPKFFEYLLHCPAVRFSLHGLVNDRELRGHFVIGTVRGQARLAGVWLREPSQDNWRTAYTLAQQTALGLNHAFEIAARGSEGPSATAAAEAGLRVIDTAPVYLLNNRSNFTFPSDFQFQFSDDDEAFLDTGTPAYYT